MLHLSVVPSVGRSIRQSLHPLVTLLVGQLVGRSVQNLFWCDFVSYTLRGGYSNYSKKNTLFFASFFHLTRKVV